jgi:hypothetical protein
MLMLIEVSNPQQPSGHPQGRTSRHQEQRQRTEDRACEKIWPPSSQPSPGVVAGVADDGLHDESGQRSGQPQNRYLVSPRSEVFIDGAHVRHLQAPAELDAEKTETHVPDLPETLTRLLHDCLGENPLRASDSATRLPHHTSALAIAIGCRDRNFLEDDTSRRSY